jgi:tetratricopeptide (TPR) repeat protein
MSNGKSKQPAPRNQGKNPAQPKSPVTAPASSVAPADVPGGKPVGSAWLGKLGWLAGPMKAFRSSGARGEPLFRRIDWITFAATTLLVFTTYFLTLSPDLGLEDSGELAVGSFYAGVPHPPGYPVWTLYTWLFTHIPYSNIAWRVALSSAVAQALACGLLALMVSRGSSLLLEGIGDFKGIDRKIENAICLVSGFVAGTLLGFNGIAWSQAVIVEVYTFSVLSYMAVLICLFRWIYAPEQRRYLYWAAFWFGICFTNHQTLIVAAMGIQVAILAAHPKLGRDVFLANGIIYLLVLMGKAMGLVTTFANNPPLFIVFNIVGLGSLAAAGYMTLTIGKPLSEWKTVLVSLALWLLGASFYFYMPIASMTNPPMNWGYPRTVEGFVHALTRGQYDKTNPTDTVTKFFGQVGMYHEVAIDEFSLIYLVIGLVPFLFWSKMQKRERAWLIGLVSMYILLSFLLLILLNPQVDKQSREQTRVFFIPAHIVLALLIGYGVTLISGVATVLYERHRQWLLWGGTLLTAMQLYFTLRVFEGTLFPLLRAAEVVALVSVACFTLIVLLHRKKVPVLVLVAIFAFAPVRSLLSNWSDAEQRGHLFGYWFGHDMFTPPFDVYPEMSRDAVLFGGTDPGRFCPTYMIFCESFIAPKYKPRDPEFDRRDVYIITQNALADGTYLNYIRAHYNRSTQQDPYFFSELLRSKRAVHEGRTGILARAALPLDRFFTGLGHRVEEKRRARGVYPPKEIHTPSPKESEIAFHEYIADAQRRARLNQLKPGEDVKFVGQNVQVSGQVAVMALNGLLTKVIFDRNPDHEFYVEESFPLDWMFPHLTPFGIIMKINRQQVPEITEEMMRKDHEFWRKYSERLIGDIITYDTTIKEVCDFAERVYLRRDYRGFQGDRKFVRNTVAQKSFSKLRSAIGGLYSWRLSPDCPPELRPKGLAEQQRVLKEAEFALLQSYAFCPYSPEAVMKLMNVLLPSGRIADAMLVTQTSLKFDPTNPHFRFLLDQLEKMTSQQPMQAPPQDAAYAKAEELFRRDPSNLQAALDLANAYRQHQRQEAATQILDYIAAHPGADVAMLLSVAQAYAEMGSSVKLDAVLQKLSSMASPLLERYRANPSDIQTAFQLVSVYIVSRQTNDAVQLLDELTGRPDADPSLLLSAAQAYAELQQPEKLEGALQRLVVVMPDNAEAWYDLATVQAALGKHPEAVQSLRISFELNRKRLSRQPAAKDLRATAANEPRFGPLRNLPEFKQLMKAD